VRKRIKVRPLSYAHSCDVCERTVDPGVHIVEPNVNRNLTLCESCAGHIARWWNKMQMRRPKRARTTQARNK
jgi:ribosome-binding protein aMBF1 (putative translation factor)